jgi:hypothetical protein
MVSILTNPATVPGLDEHFRKAFNAKRGDFLGEPVFAFTFGGNDPSDPFGPSGIVYPIPDGISFDPGFEETDTNIGRYISTSQEYDSTYSIDVSAEASYAGFSGAVGSSYFQHEYQFQSNDTSFTMDYFVATIYTARRTAPDQDPSFAAALAGLPGSLDGNGSEKYGAFFDTYGTHYVVSAPFGGYMMMTSSAETSVLNQSNNEASAANVHAAFTTLGASGSLTVSTAESNLDVNTSKIVTLDNHLVYVGGIGDSDKEKWEGSIYVQPVPLIGLPASSDDVERPLFAELANLEPDAGRQAVMKAAMAAYLASPAPPSPPVQAPVSFGTVQQATSDGFIVAYVDASPTGQSGSSALALRAENSENPQQIRAGGAARYDNENREPCVWLEYASATAPIEQGEYYVADQVDPSAQGYAQFVPLGGGLRFGAVTPADLSGTAASDGFLVVNLAGTAGAEGQTATAMGTLAGQWVSACSVESVDRFIAGRDEQLWGSFCMPVPNGQAYEVQLVSYWGDNSGTVLGAVWIPLMGTAFPTAIQTRDLSRAYTAENDGILFGRLHCDDGNRGSLLVRVTYVGADPSTVGSAPVLQATSAHQFQQEGIYGTDEAVTLPVTKGQTYQIEPQWTSGNLDAPFFWLDLGTS